MAELIAQEIERLLGYEVMELGYAQWLMAALERLDGYEDWQLREIAVELCIEE